MNWEGGVPPQDIHMVANFGIQVSSMLDFKTGRRYLHNLDKIIVGQAQ